MLREEERSAEKKKSKNKETKSETKEEKRAEKDEKILPEEKNTTSVALSCIDKFRDELSCAICLEICYEPILWNTIQLMFPKEVEAQRAAASANFLTKETPSPRDSNQKVRSRNRDTAFQARLQREDISRLLVSEERRRRGVRLDQDSDAAFALRLQRQEFASAFGGTVAEGCIASFQYASKRGVRLDQDSDAAFALRLQRQEFASAFGGTVAETISTSSSSTALPFLLLLPKQI
uniref:RING-type E3 ubiquitin transferase n=1 Tax=Brassica oleracea var. oleracea TaxID=109376 RepID=A0A0D3AMT5_BRAOL